MEIMHTKSNNIQENLSRHWCCLFCPYDNNNKSRLFMEPHLVRALGTYRSLQMCTFVHTHEHTHTIACLHVSHTYTHCTGICNWTLSQSQWLIEFSSVVEMITVLEWVLCACMFVCMCLHACVCVCVCVCVMLQCLKSRRSIFTIHQTNTRAVLLMVWTFKVTLLSHIQNLNLCQNIQVSQ